MIDLSQNFLVKGDKTKVGSVTYYNLFAVKTQLRKIEDSLQLKFRSP